MNGGPGNARGREAESQVLAGAVSVAALLVAFHRALPQLHALNFDTAGPGPTAGLAAVLVTGWTIPLAARNEGDGVRAAGLAAAAGLALGASLAPQAAVAVAAGLACFPLLTPGLAALAQADGPRAGAGLAAGVLLHQALRVGTGGAPLAATGLGRVLAALLALGLAGAWLGLLVQGWVPALPARGLADAAPLLLAVLAQAAFLGGAEAPATWGGSPRFPTAVASAAGLAAGGLAAAGGRVPTGRGRWAWAGLLALAVADLVWWDLSAGLAVAPAQASLVLLAAGGAAAGPRRSRAAAGGRTAGAQAVGVLLLVGIVWAGNWPFVPLGSLFQGQAGPLLAGLLVLPGLLAVPWRAATGRGSP